MDQLVTLTGWIPVTVLVDLPNREVRTVYAHDQEFHYHSESESEFGTIAQAREVAESQDWPAWEWA